jgi:AraC family transcriptional regulator, transcriptional activator of pobA
MQEVQQATDILSLRKLERRMPDLTDADNFQILFVEHGIAGITVDLKNAPVFENSIFFILPTQVIKLKYTCEAPAGWILKFSRRYLLDQHLDGLNINNTHLFSLNGEIPGIVLSPKIGQRVNSLAEMISEVLQSGIPNRELGASSLMKTLLVYCDSSCNIRLDTNANRNETHIVTSFKQHVARNFYSKHYVSDYAGIMNISPRYLNQVVKKVMGVTAKSVILEQILIQACRDLKFSNESIKEISHKLGFAEPEHFSNFFRKATGTTPTAFRGS